MLCFVFTQRKRTQAKAQEQQGKLIFAKLFCLRRLWKPGFIFNLALLVYLDKDGNK